MLLESIEAYSFRNLSGNLGLDPGLTILTGENGQGKTNWLEAIAILASGRSFRTQKLQEAAAFGESGFTVRGSVREAAEITRTLGVLVQGNAKTLSVNGKRETAQAYLGQLNAVVFNSDELEIVRGTPDARRRFLDSGIVSLHPPFVQVLSDYAKVIRQKNALLQSARERGTGLDAVRDSVDPWNSQLAVLAGKIYRARIRYVDRINAILEKQLFGREELSIRYLSSLEGKGDLSQFEALLTDRLAFRTQAEVVAGHSLVGTHRDDLQLTFDGHDIRKYGSAGQQRSALLLLQLANIAVFHATRGEYPLFLIDDIDAELDYHRIRKLLEFLKGKSQTLVTTSKESFIEEFGTLGTVLRVSNGTVECP